MKKNLFKVSLCLMLQRILFAKIFLSVIFIAQPIVTFAEEIKWSTQQLAILKTLWIDSAKVKKDLSNAIVDNPIAINLGHKIFFDPRFSGNGKISCASCHQPEHFFSDNLDTGKGLNKLTRNTPTIVGASRNTWFFHDGRNDSLWSQAMGPLENQLEHGGSRNQFAHIIFSDPILHKEYSLLFGSIPDISNNKRFPKKAGPIENKDLLKSWQAMNIEDQKIITDIFVNIGKIIAAYETQLQPAPSRFDHYVKSLLEKNIEDMQEPLSEDEIKGLQLFIGKGRCTTCIVDQCLLTKVFIIFQFNPVSPKNMTGGVMQAQNKYSKVLIIVEVNTMILQKKKSIINAMNLNT